MSWDKLSRRLTDDQLTKLHGIPSLQVLMNERLLIHAKLLNSYRSTLWVWLEEELPER